MEGLKDARVVVTGAYGFLGQHVCAALQAAGAQVIPISRRNGFDLTLEARAVTAVLLPRPQLVIHLAGTPDDGPFSGVARVHDTLLMGLNVLNACRMGGTKVVLISRNGPPRSSELAVREALMAAGRAHQREHSLEFVQIVPCDLYGPHDHFPELPSSRFVPTVLGGIARVKAKKAKSATFKGNPKRPLPLLYVEDAAKAILTACSLPGCDEPLELSGPETLPIEEIAGKAAKCLEFNGEVSWDSKGNDPWVRGPHDGEVAREILGWKPEVKVEGGLKATLDWLASSAQKK